MNFFGWLNGKRHMRYTTFELLDNGKGNPLATNSTKVWTRSPRMVSIMMPPSSWWKESHLHPDLFHLIKSDQIRRWTTKKTTLLVLIYLISSKFNLFQIYSISSIKFDSLHTWLILIIREHLIQISSSEYQQYLTLQVPCSYFNFF